ncbi:MAG: formylglycine-generating enzyme family protein [Kiritimatiellae bacterium]|nr:formylglycine-generating enzyme family protein [Kiritimatiellia bacterium]
MKKLVMTAAAFAALSASAAIAITDVSARQRWPWNGLVDVDFTIAGAATGEAFAVDVDATASGGATQLSAKTYATEPIATTGANRVVWDFGADYPEFRANDVRVSVTVTPFSGDVPVYMVIDISGGPTAAKWPVRYTTKAPAFTVGAADPCKTTEIWLKRVKAGTNAAMGRTQWTSYGSYKTHTCTLTNDYYLGIFPVTQAQFRNLDAQEGRDLSKFTNPLYSATRPVDGVAFTTLRAFLQDYTHGYDKTDAVGDGCIIAYLRQRTGLKTIDLPTEWQWEYACRAGTAAQRYDNATYRAGSPMPAEDDETYADPGLWTEDYGTSYVDRYDPNPWGFYGMIGNVWEWCANWMLSGIGEGDVLVEPRGGAPVSSSGTPSDQRYYYHVARGGAWNSNSNYTYNHTRNNVNTWAAGYPANLGFRLCIPVRGEILEGE